MKQSLSAFDAALDELAEAPSLTNEALAELGLG